MKNETYYIVSWSGQEEYAPAIVSGPEVEDWQAYCAALLPEAVERALATKKYVDGPRIIDELIDMLEVRGYRQVEFKEFNVEEYPGRRINSWFSEDDARRIEEHNKLSNLGC